MANQATAHSEESSTKRIWLVFILLSVVTLVEVILGIFKPQFLTHTSFISLSLLNWIFIILTIYKAYYITWAFMHMEHETKGLRRSIVWTGVFLISYMLFIILVEGNFSYDVLMDSFIKWDF